MHILAIERCVCCVSPLAGGKAAEESGVNPTLAGPEGGSDTPDEHSVAASNAMFATLFPGLFEAAAEAGPKPEVSYSVCWAIAHALSVKAVSCSQRLGTFVSCTCFLA